MSSINFVQDADGDCIRYDATGAINNNSDWTAIFWIRYGANTANFNYLMNKQVAGGDNDNQRLITFFGATKQYVVRIGRGTGTRCNYVGGGTLDLSGTVWSYVAVTYEFDATGDDVKLYEGDLATSAVLFSGWGTSDDGSGTLGDDSATDLHFMNFSDSAGSEASINADIAFIGYWNRTLTLGEILAQQFHPHPTSGCVIFTFPGFNGLASTQPNWSSGTVGNGTLTGVDTSFSLAAGVPLGPTFGFDPGWSGAFTEAVAGLGPWPMIQQPLPPRPAMISY